MFPLQQMRYAAVMQNLAILFSLLALVTGCSSRAPDPPADVVGFWSADFLFNTSTVALGPDVSPFGDLNLKAAQFGEGADTYVGPATAEFKAYAVQGTVDAPISDANGELLYEVVGTISYTGQWEDYTPIAGIALTLNCQKVDIVPTRPDVQALCGAPGFDTEVKATCDRAEGSSTLECQFATNSAVTIVFNKQ
jgi:hypothetical protein